MAPTQLTTGSEKPKPVESGLRIYSMRFCPYAQRTRLVLAAKGIDHELLNVDLSNKPEWFHEVSPDLRVPALELPGGKLVWDSLICSDYLEEMFPEKTPLLAKEPYTRAQDRLMIALCDSKVIPNMYRIMSKAAEDKDHEELKVNLRKVDKLLCDRKTKFFGGDTAGMADYMIYSFMRYTMLMTPHLEESTVPVLFKWLGNMNEDPAAIETNYPEDVVVKFREGVSKGEPDYLLGSDIKP